MKTEGSAVAIGIDAAVVADHHVMVRRRDGRGPGTLLEEFPAPPTVAGMERLANKVPVYPGAVAVAEPTSMTWVPLALVLADAGCSFSLVGNRHVARLRGALPGKNKSDVIDAEMLSRADEFFALAPARIPTHRKSPLRRAALLRDKAVLDANRARCACCPMHTAPLQTSGGLSAVPGQQRWQCSVDGPHVGVTQPSPVGYANRRGGGAHPRRCRRRRSSAPIRAAAHGWNSFWEGHLDLDALGS